MSRSLNKVLLIGNLGKDPEIRSTSGGQRVAEFSLATSRTWNDASGTRQEKTEWHRCVVWSRGSQGGGLVDVVERYLKKGDKVYVEGAIEYRQWQDKEGQTRYATDIKVTDLVMLGGGRGGDEGMSSPAPRRAAAPAAAAKGKPAAASDFEDFPAGGDGPDDDLPF